MSKNYFEKFPKISYPLGNKEVETVDLSVRFKIVSDLMKRPDAYYEYMWQDTDRVDIVADKYYGDSRYSWLVQMSGDVWDWIYDLPLNEDLFDNYLKSKYNIDDTNILHHKLHHYEDASGMIIDEATYNMIPDEYKERVTIYDYEFKVNEEKRNVKLLSKTYLKEVSNELDKRLQLIKNNRRLFKTE